MKQKLNYRQIYLNLTKNFPKRVKNVLIQRFGFEKGKPETLESVGKDFGITRERIRQIQEYAFSDIKRENKPILDKIYRNFFSYFEKCGGFKKEDILLTDLGEKNFQRYIYFFLTLGEPFFRYYEKKEYLFNMMASLKQLYGEDPYYRIGKALVDYNSTVFWRSSSYIY